MSDDRSLVKVINLKELKDGSVGFVVVWRTSLGPLYIRGNRLLKNGQMSAPALQFGKLSWKIVKYPKLAKAAIKKKLLRRLRKVD